MSPRRSPLSVSLLVLASVLPALPELGLHSTVSISLASSPRPQDICIIDMDKAHHNLCLGIKLGARHLLPALMTLASILRSRAGGNILLHETLYLDRVSYK